MMNLSERVENITHQCLYRDEEIIEPGTPPNGAVVVKVILRDFAFHPGRLEARKDDIRAVLDEMDPNFHKSGGGGWSFLNLCMDRNGSQWAEHPTMETLCVLAIAVGYGEFQLPREMWESLPGGMPYIVFDTSAEQADCQASA